MPERTALAAKCDSVALIFIPNVTGHARKQYLARKAKTNFVDGVPQKLKITLSINLPFGDRVDPRSLVRDVSKMGRWGHGYHEAPLDEGADFDYILGVMRQSYECQLDADIWFCQFATLYWGFLDRHKDELKKNHPMSRQVYRVIRANRLSDVAVLRVRAQEVLEG